MKKITIIITFIIIVTILFGYLILWNIIDNMSGGGECFYQTIKGVCTITSLNETDPISVYFKFNLTEKIKSDGTELEYKTDFYINYVNKEYYK